MGSSRPDSMGLDTDNSMLCHNISYGISTTPQYKIRIKYQPIVKYKKVSLLSIVYDKIIMYTL
jgi:hypothetical protein